MNIDNKYIIDGVTIDKIKEGYKVFTIPTQHFNITSLDELTNERFEQEIERQVKYEKDSSELIRLWLEDNENIIEVTKPVFIINLDNPREFSYNPNDGNENWKTVMVQNYTFGFPELKENQILYKYTENRGYIYEQTR